MKHSVLTFVSQALLQLTGVIGGILAARYLGPEGRGGLAAIVTWTSSIAYIGDLGFGAAVLYRVAKNRDMARQIVVNSVAVGLIQSAVLIGIGYGAMSLLHPAKVDATLLVNFEWFLPLFIPLNLLTRYLVAVLQGRGEYSKFNAVRLSVPLTYVAILVAISSFTGLTIAKVLTSNIISNVVGLSLGLIFNFECLKGAPQLNFRRIAKDMRYGLKAYVGVLQPFTALQLDILLLSVIVAKQSLGLYVAAAAAGVVIKAQGQSLGLVLLPEMARSPMHQQFHIMKKHLIVAAAAGVSTAAVAAIWARELLAMFFGAPFASAANLLRVIVVGAVVASIYRVVGDGLRGMGLAKQSSIAETAGLVVGVATMVILSPWWGAMGAACSTLVASCISLAVSIQFLRKSSRNDLNRQFASAS